jgi:hypothetical protein
VAVVARVISGGNASLLRRFSHLLVCFAGNVAWEDVDASEVPSL